MVEEKPFKLDIACGKNKQPGFTGIDKYEFPGVDIIQDLEKYPYPFKDDSVDEVFCSHYIEHVSDMVQFINEVHRILKPGAPATIVAPYYASMRAWQDPTHRRAISEATFLYFNKAWRETNTVDFKYLGITADFDFTYGYVMTPDWANRSEEARSFAIRHYMNVVNDIQVVLRKR